MSGEASVSSRKLPSFEEMKKNDMGRSYYYLNKLLKGKSPKDFDNLEELLSCDKPLPLFEESLRLIVIDSLQMENEVIKILLSQNDYKIKRILKCKWFFEKPSTAEFWISQIFPRVSLVTRRNIIMKLSKYWKFDEEAEKLVKYLCDEYGGVFGEPLIGRCGKDFVRNFIKRNKAPFRYNTSPRALLNVSRRYPDLGVEVLNFMCESDIHYDINQYKLVIKYIASHHPDLFIPFYEKQYLKLPYLYFGKALSSHLAHKIKYSIFKSRELMNTGLLKRRAFFKSLNFEDRIKFVEAHVRFSEEKLTYNSWVGAQYSISDILKPVKPEDQLHVVEKVFQMLYNSEFKNHPELWTRNILELFPTQDRLFFVEKLEKLLMEAQQKDSNDFYCFFLEEPETLLYLYSFEIGFEKLKKVMSKAATITRRENVLLYMVKNCALDKTPEGIERLIDYVTERHRQDDPTILSQFQDQVFQDLLCKTEIKSRALEKLEEVAYLWALKGHMNNYERISEKLILSRLDEKLEVGNHMKKFFKFSFLDRTWSHVFLYSFKSIHSKNLFFAYCEDIMQWIQANPNDEEKKEAMVKSIISTCMEYNEYHPDHPIRLLEIPKLQKELRNLLKKTFEGLGGEDWPLEIWDRFYMNVFYGSYKLKNLRYILKKFPETFVKILDKVLESSSKVYDFDEFFALMKKMFSFYNLTETMKEKNLNKLKKGDAKSKKQALQLYSQLAELEEFSQVVAEYIPKEEKISNEVNPDFTEIQLKVPEVIKNIRPRWKTLNLVLKFFFGDYLRGAVPSFYSCCYFTRVDEMVPFLIEHFDKLPPKISIKKDVIRLVGDLADRRTKTEFFIKCWNDNTHYSIRTVLFSYLTKSFIDQPSKEEFEVMKKFMVEADEMVMSVRPELRRIPNEYLNEYVKALWRYSEKEPAKSRNNFRRSILSHFDQKNIAFLSKDFCEKLIKDNLFIDSSLDVTNFAICYVTSDPNETNSRICLILELLKNSISNTGAISNFLKSFLRMSSKDIQLFSNIVHAFLHNWPESLNVKLYDDYLMLQYYQLLCEVLKKYPDLEKSKNSAASEFGKKIKELLLNINNLNDLSVILIESLSSLLRDLEVNNLKFDNLYILKEFLTAPFNRSLTVIALSALPDDIIQLFNSKDTIFDAEEKQRKQIINDLVETLRNCNDGIVNLYLYKKFTNLDLPIS